MSRTADFREGRSVQLQQARIDFDSVFAAARTPYAVLTPDFEVCAANPAYLELTQRGRADVVGRSLFDAFPGDPADRNVGGRRALRASLARARAGLPDTMPVQRYDITTPAGEFEERYWTSLNVPVLDDRGETVLILHRPEDLTSIVCGSQPGRETHGEDLRRRMSEAEADLMSRVRELQSVNDELRATRDQLTTLALHDPMTGLLVRPVFLSELTRALARLGRHPGSLAVLFVDLDRLKPVNDNHGHAAGDEMLRRCAQRLRDSVRPSDVVARMGGDEFVVLVEDLADPAESEVVARRVLANLAEPVQVRPGIVVQPTASIGVAFATGSHVTADALVSRADAAMYRAKQSGRGRYEMFDEAAYSAASTRQQLEHDLRGAVTGGQLRLEYQPIIDLSTGAVQAVEALLRWQHPVRGLLSAGDFIDVAEESGAIRDVGAWVVEQACSQLAEWDAVLGSRAPRRMFVNLSVVELSSPGLEEQVVSSVAHAGISADRLVLEITETGILDDPGRAGGVLETLVRLGCHLAIDDFGTGYSSLSRLVQMPVDIVKIDQSFVQQMCSSRESAAIVSAVLLLAHNLQQTVVAEGIEDADTLTALTDLGCQYAQGYHLARPQCPKELTETLARTG